MGSTAIVHQLAAKDLVDEYRLLVHPVVLGAGERLLTVPTDLHLDSVDADGAGVLLRYSVSHGAECNSDDSR